MEAERLKESDDKVKDSLDARQYNPPTELLPPPPPTDVEQPSTSSQTPSTGHIALNPNSQKGWLLQLLMANTPQYSPLKRTWQNMLKNTFSARHYPQPITLKDQDPETKNALGPGTQIPYRFPNKDARTYELERFKENRMIIFNHDEFLTKDPRPGGKIDEAILRKTFEKFRFTIDPTYENLKMTQLLTIVEKFAQTDFSAYGCICVAILTHGHTSPGYLMAKDERYNEYEIFKHFDASKPERRSLAAKPIIFIIQACRGRLPSQTVNAGENKSAFQLDHGEKPEDYHLPTEADRIVFHSSYPGKASVRDITSGTWFIQKLCEKINEYALTHDLETIFRLVRRAVALDCKSDQDWKQMPVVTSTTLREIYLAPTLQKHEKEEPRPASPYVFRYLTDDPEVYPLSHQVVEGLDEHVGSVTTSDPDAAPVQMKLHHLPCCCFVEYFEYLKKCLESFSRHNTQDSVAKNLLKLVKRPGPGSEYNLQKFDYIQSMWEHFEDNRHCFPPDGFDFVHRMYHVQLKEPDTERLEPL